MPAKRTVMYFTIEPQARNRFKAAAALTGKSLRVWALEAMREKAERELTATLGAGQGQGRPTTNPPGEGLPIAEGPQPPGASEKTRNGRATEERREEGTPLQDVLTVLSRHRTELEGLGAKSLAVFGSVARGEAGPDSDVDVLAEFRQPVGIFGLLELKYRLEDLLGRKVDLVSRSGVHPALRDRIFAEAVDAF